MADTKLSSENAAAALGGTELFRGVQSGGDVKITASQIWDYVVTTLGTTLKRLAFNKGARVKQCLFASASSVSVSTGTTETSLASLTIPGGVLGPNGYLIVTTHWTYTNSANTKTLRARAGGISGTAYLAAAVTSTAQNQLVTFIHNVAAQNSQKGFPAAAVPFGASTTAAAVTSAVDTSADWTLEITGQTATSGETITLQRYTVEAVYMP